MWKLPSRHGSIVFLNPQNCSITHIFHVMSVWFCSGGEWTGFLFLLNWASDSVGLIISSVGTEIQAQISRSHSISHQVLATSIVFSLCNEAKSNSNSGSMSSSVPPTLLNPREKPYSWHCWISPAVERCGSHGWNLTSVSEATDRWWELAQIKCTFLTFKEKNYKGTSRVWS